MSGQESDKHLPLVCFVHTQYLSALEFEKKNESRKWDPGTDDNRIHLYATGADSCV